VSAIRADIHNAFRGKNKPAVRIKDLMPQARTVNVQRQSWREQHEFLLARFPKARRKTKKA